MQCINTSGWSSEGPNGLQHRDAQNYHLPPTPEVIKNIKSENFNYKSQKTSSSELLLKTEMPVLHSCLLLMQHTVCTNENIDFLK